MEGVRIKDMGSAYRSSIYGQRALLLLQGAEPAQGNGSLRVIDFMAATESPDSNSVKAGSFD